MALLSIILEMELTNIVYKQHSITSALLMNSQVKSWERVKGICTMVLMLVETEYM